MLLLLATGLLALPTSLATVLIAILAKARRGVLLVLGLAKLAITALVLVVGGVGCWMQRLEVAYAVELAAPDAQQELLQRGLEIAARTWRLSLLVALLPALVTLGLFVAAALRPSRPAPSPSGDDPPAP